MERLPNELYDEIVTQLHNQYCLCATPSSRQSVWDIPRREGVFWDSQPAVLLQRDLCALRLVNKRFSAAASRFFDSHTSLTLGVSTMNSWAVSEKIQRCKDADESAFAHATGVRIDLRLKEVDRHLPALDPAAEERALASSDIDRLDNALDARDGLLRCLRGLTAPFASATALEIRLGHDYALQHSILVHFIRFRMPNITDLALECESVSALRTLASMHPQQCHALRRLLVSCTPAGRNGVPQQVMQFPRLAELSLHGFHPGPVMLHGQHRGLTRLRLSNVSTPASYLLAAVTRGPASAFPLGPGGLGRGSPLVELVLSDMSLDVFGHDGVYESGTWTEVFDTIRESCAQLKELEVNFFCYGLSAAQRLPPGQGRMVDLVALGRLFKVIRSRPGGQARGRVREADGKTLRVL